MENYDVIVVGGGHAGCEAALAAARLGMNTLMVTHSIDKIAVMSCNPAIGGTAKGHLVKEIDALGGEMAKAIDATGIQFRVLNRKKGPAIWSSRAQADMDLYHRYMKSVISTTPNLKLRQDAVVELIVEEAPGPSLLIKGVKTRIFGVITAKTVIVTTGTFLSGLVHIGATAIGAGRIGDPPSLSLAESIKRFGVKMGRMKTGTVPRLDAKTIDWSELEYQDSDRDIIPFSFATHKITQKLLPCHITYTNENTHSIIKKYLHQSPLYSGKIEGIGPRYCPSIEDKIVKFGDRPSHQVFLEPQGYDTCEVYPNGLSTSLPLEAQLEFIRSIKGLERADIIRPGYAIEYDFIDPTQLTYSLESKALGGLYFAGQVNGTTGYEEAAAQGLIAGINAVLKVQGRTPLVLKRSQAYIGVLIDDLISKGVTEPYRMFTSRAEHRLHLREDNADVRLTKIGRDIGLITDEAYRGYLDRLTELNDALKYIRETPIRDHSLPQEFLSSNDNNGTKLDVIIRRPELAVEKLVELLTGFNRFSPVALRRAAIELKYEGYIERERRLIKNFDEFEKIRIPRNLVYKSLNGLSREVVEILSKHQPENLGQASRISGITPSAIQILQVYIRQN